MLLGGTTGLCFLASLIVSTQTAVTAADPSESSYRATASSINTASATTYVEGEADALRVISRRLVSSEKAMLVYGNSKICDSMLVDSRLVVDLCPGDIVSDGEGSIER